MMPGILPEVSVVIPTYRRRSGISQVLNAVLADPDAAEVVVVVDGCHDGTFELAERLSTVDGRVRPIWQDNSGEAAARQTGALAARSEVLLFLDDDVVIKPGLVRGHAEHHARAADLVVVGYMPTLRPSAGERRPGSFSTDLYADEYERTCAGYEAAPERILLGLWAGNISIRREDALRIGLDRGQRLGYHDDLEFGLRCHLGGLTGVFDRSLAAEHHHVRDLPTFLRQAHTAGAARRRLEQRYPELSLRLDPRLAIGRPLGTLVGALSNRLGAPAAAAMRVTADAAGRARLWRLERTMARLLRQRELFRGYRANTV